MLEAPNDPSCAFCRIAAGEHPAKIVFRNPQVMAFLDHRPLFPGHVLVIPRGHIETLDDISTAGIEPLFSAVRLVSAAVRRAMVSQGTFVAVNNRVSQSVPHLHVHVVPRNKGDGLRGFFWPRNPYRDEEHMDDVCERIAQACSEIEASRS